MKNPTGFLKQVADLASAVLRPIWQEERSRDADPAAAMREMKWANLQLLLAEAFRCEGFLVKEIGGESADMVLTRPGDGAVFLVDCRQWNAIEVGMNAVARLYGAIGRLGARGGFVVTTGSFAPDAVDFARGLQIDLIGGRRLAGMLEVAKETISGAFPARPLAS